MSTFILLQRLQSFLHWPPDVTSVSPVTLANAGFKYTGYRDRVSCPVCLIEIEGWESRISAHPRVIHITRSPRCSLALECSQADSSSSPDRNSRLGNQSSSSSASHDGLGRAAFAFTDGRAAKPHSSPSLADSNDCSKTSLSATAAAHNPDTLIGALVTGLSVDGIDRSNPDFGRLKVERVRLGTFYDWPTGAHVKPSELAADGWFYTGQNDRVCCVFCRGILHNWSKNDKPTAEHRRHFPNCPFVRGRDVNNVPLEKRTTAVSEPRGAAAADGRCAELNSKDIPDNTKISMTHKDSAAAGSRATGNGVPSKENGINRLQHGEAAVAELDKAADDDEEEEQRLLAENRQLMEARTCRVCMDNEVNTVFLPCGHLVTCHVCAPKLRDCPLCRTYIRGTVKTFLP